MNVDVEMIIAGAKCDLRREEGGQEGGSHRRSRTGFYWWSAELPAGLGSCHFFWRAADHDIVGGPRDSALAAAGVVAAPVDVSPPPPPATGVVFVLVVVIAHSMDSSFL